MAEGYFIISLDFDGVLAQGFDVKKKYAKKWFGVEITPDSSKKEGFNTLMKTLSKNINYRDLMDPLNELHIMEYTLPQGCVEVLNRLFTQNCRFVVITSRNEHDYPYAVKFIKKNLDGLIKYIHNTKNEPKNRLIERIRPRVHVDDDLTKLEEIRQFPVELIYFRQIENQNEKAANSILEACSFYDLEEIVLKMRNSV